MNEPCGVLWARAPGIPMAAGTWRGDPFTKMVRCAWMWKMVCSLDWHPIPSTLLPVAPVAVLARGAAVGIGTPPSGPAVTAPDAGLRAPSVPSEASLSRGLPPFPLPEPLPPPPPATASPMPTAAAISTTAAPMPVSQLRRRLRRASAARISAIFALACCLVLLPFDTDTRSSSAGRSNEDSWRPGPVRPDARAPSAGMPACRRATPLRDGWQPSRHRLRHKVRARQMRWARRSAELSWAPDDVHLAVGATPAAAINTLEVINARRATDLN